MQIANSVKFWFSSNQPNQYLNKFYQQATVQETETKVKDDIIKTYSVSLDGKDVKTPNRHQMEYTMNRALPQVIAHQFNMQETYLKPATMPILSLSRTAIDVQMDPNIRGHLQDSFLTFLKNDTVCFWEQDVESKLSKLQKLNFAQIIDFINQELQINIKPRFSLFENNQFNQQEMQSIQNYLQSLSARHLVSLETLTINFQSASLAYCVLNKFIDPIEGLRLSRMEEIYQIELFGRVEGTHDFEQNTLLLNVLSAYLLSSLG